MNRLLPWYITNNAGLYSWAWVCVANGLSAAIIAAPTLILVWALFARN